MSLARRYARALLEISRHVDAIEETAARLDDVSAAIRQNPALDEVLRSPMYPREKRRAILREVATSSGAPEHLAIFLDFMFERDRLDVLHDLARVFRQIADEEIGILRGEVVSAEALPAGQLEQLTGALSRATGRKVSLNTRQDPELLGGVLARVGDIIYDGSVRGQLRQIRDALINEG